MKNKLSQRKLVMRKVFLFSLICSLSCFQTPFSFAADDDQSGAAAAGHTEATTEQKGDIETADPGNSDPATETETPEPDVTKPPVALPDNGEGETADQVTPLPEIDESETVDPIPSLPEMDESEPLVPSVPDASQDTPPEEDTNVSPPALKPDLPIVSVPSPVLNVRLPSSLPFVIDPYEIAGKGSVYSEDISFENYSDIDVIVHIRSVNVDFSGSGEFNPVEEPVETLERSAEKSMYLFLHRVSGSEDTSAVEMIGEEDFLISNDQQTENSGFSFTLSAAGENPEHSTTVFRLAGSVNPMPASSWISGEVWLNMVISVEPVLPEEVLEEPMPEESVPEEPLSDPAEDSGDQGETELTPMPLPFPLPDETVNSDENTGVEGEGGEAAKEPIDPPILEEDSDVEQSVPEKPSVGIPETTVSPPATDTDSDQAVNTEANHNTESQSDVESGSSEEGNMSDS